MSMSKPLLASFAIAAITSSLPAQFSLSEIMNDPPGTDQGQEAVEIRGAPNASLAGYYLLVIDGDGTAAGVVDQSISLATYTTGSNGLLLLRDTTAILLPAPDPATTVVVLDFTPDIENGTNTFALGHGTAPAVNTDLDTNNDGILDNGIPGFTTIDAVSASDGGSGSRVYARQLGGYDIPYSNQFTPDAYYRIYDENGVPFCWTIADVLAPGATGPYRIDFVARDYQGGLAPGYGPQGLNLGSLNERISLSADVYGVSTVAGGAQNMEFDAGTANAGKTYLVLGSFAGISPGIPLTPTVTLPLNYDAYLLLTASVTNTPILMPSTGILDARGRVTTKFTLPPNLGLPTGTAIHHAALVLDLSIPDILLASTPATVFTQ
jgi:hypothetical protein